MPSPTNYVDSVRDTASLVTGRSAPETGEYYSHVYSGKDIDTGVPVVGVDLHIERDTQPMPLSSVRDAASLDIVLNGQPQAIPATNAVTTHIQSTSTPNGSQQNIISDGGALPLGGLIVLVLLTGLAWLVYTIIRIWQNNQAHRALVRASVTNSKPIVEHPAEPVVPIVNPVVQPATPSITTTFNINSIETDLAGDSVEGWRSALSTLDAELLKLLDSKGIEGETISDKLKAVSAGEFASVDIAWEAHQTAKNLLAMHDDQLKTQDLTRCLKLFKQVFAEHGVI
jgi:hypothetical protein